MIGTISTTISVIVVLPLVASTSIKRCCPPNQNWNTEQSGCEQGDDSPLRALTNINLDDNASADLGCDNRETFILEASGNSVSAGGHLVTSKYGPKANITQFCLSASQTGDLIALTCNLCLLNSVNKVSPHKTFSRKLNVKLS